MKLVEILKRRRKEARQMGRLIHPEPFISEIRRRRKRVVKPDTLLGITIERTLDFVEGVGKILRNPTTWQSATASLIVSTILNTLLGKK